MPVLATLKRANVVKTPNDVGILPVIFALECTSMSWINGPKLFGIVPHSKLSNILNSTNPNKSPMLLGIVEVKWLPFRYIVCREVSFDSQVGMLEVS